MSKYLLDTNILLRVIEADSPDSLLANRAIIKIFADGDECLITPQVLVEFWSVVTRPVTVNGLGLTGKQCQKYINGFLQSFMLIQENSDIFPYWLQLVSQNDIKGKRVHDVRLLALMKSQSIDNLLTFNVKDFMGISDFTIVHPQNILSIG